MAVKRMVALIECDFCGLEKLDPPNTWKTFDLAVHSVGWRPVVSLCPDCIRMPIGEVIARLEAKYGEKADA